MKMVKYSITIGHVILLRVIIRTGIQKKNFMNYSDTLKS